MKPKIGPFFISMTVTVFGREGIFFGLLLLLFFSKKKIPEMWRPSLSSTINKEPRLIKLSNT